MKPLHSKPFNIEHAKAGAPFAATTGYAVEILKWDRKASLPIVGIIDDGFDAVMAWNTGGTNAQSANAHLVMLPLGYIDGKPVFVGDELESRDRRDDNWHACTALPNNRDFSICRFKEAAPAAPKWPETTMGDSELCAMFVTTPTEDQKRIIREGVNAAIAHACETGQLVTKEFFTTVVQKALESNNQAIANSCKAQDAISKRDEVIETLRACVSRKNDRMSELRADRADRDKAIAEAVAHAYQHAKYTIAGPDAVDLAAIIAGVKP